MIQIKTPCDAHWQEMTPANNGKYCASCEKVVVDFSKMNDAQIKNYFAEHTKQKTCGRFLTSQLDRPLTLQKNTFAKRVRSNTTFPLLRSILLFCASSVVFITSCVKRNVVTGEVENTCEPIIMGDSIAVPGKPDTSAYIQEDTIHVLQGEISEPVSVKIGKIKMVDTISQKIDRRK